MHLLILILALIVGLPEPPPIEGRTKILNPAICTPSPPAKPYTCF
jgi:hypothetical protein